MNPFNRKYFRKQAWRTPHSKSEERFFFRKKKKKRQRLRWKLASLSSKPHM